MTVGAPGHHCLVLGGPGGDGSGRHRHPTRAPRTPGMGAMSGWLTSIGIQS